MVLGPRGCKILKEVVEGLHPPYKTLVERLFILLPSKEFRDIREAPTLSGDKKVVFSVCHVKQP